MTVARICNGCKRIAQTKRGYCTNCQPAQNRARNARPLHSIHNTSAWRRARAQALARDGGRCTECGGPARSVHVTGDYSDPFNVDELVTLCSRCHGRIDGKRSHQLSRAQKMVRT